MEQYLIERIRTTPHMECIVRNSIPVVSFGDFTKVNVATLGINPSKNEFHEEYKNKRFTDLLSLNVRRHDLLAIKQVEEVFDSCCQYFQFNPYRKWFDKLENYVLTRLNVSYYNGTACHLDLIQWATDPIWRGLKYEDQQSLLNSDFPFLLKQLENSSINTLIINGLTAQKLFFNALNHSKFTNDWISCDGKKCRIINTVIHINDKKIKVLAYSSNLQSTVGLSNNMRNEIGSWIATHIIH
jgi:hypothetical protein